MFFRYLSLPEMKCFKRAVGLLLAGTFILPALTWAFEPKTFLQGSQLVYFESQSIEIPFSTAKVIQSFQGQDSLVIHIQDLHCNYEVQMNIAKLIASLSEKYGLKLVTVEGASLPIQVAKLRTFPIDGIREEVGQYFVRQGKLSGAEYYAATCKDPVQLEGIETPELYAAEKKLAETLVSNEAQGACADLWDALDALKSGIYNPDLLTFDQHKMDFRHGKLGVKTYARFLQKIAQARQLDLGNFPNLAKYAAAETELFKPEVDSEQVFQELEKLDQRIREQLYTQPVQLELDQWQQRLVIIEKMSNLSATAEELAEVRTQPENFSTRKFLEFIQQHNPGPDNLEPADETSLDQAFQTALEFYNLADQRSLRFVANLQKGMHSHKQKLAVLVTGGYHTEAVLAELKKQGISYLSLRPNLTHQDLVNPYFALLKNQQSPLEKLLSQNQNIFTLEPFLPQAREGEVIDERQLPKRQRLFSQSIELYLKLKTLLHFYLQKKIGLELSRAVKQSMNSYAKNTDQISLDPEQVKVHANGALSCPFRLNKVTDMLAVLSMQGHELTLADADVPVAEIGNGQIAVANGMKAPAIQAQLEQQPGTRLSDLRFGELIGVLAFLWLANRFAHNATTLWPRLAQLELARAVGSTGEQVRDDVPSPTVLMAKSKAGSGKTGQGGAVISFAMTAKGLKRGFDLGDEEQIKQALLWLEKNYSTLSPAQTEQFAGVLVEVYDGDSSKLNLYLRLWWKALNNLLPRIPGGSFREEVEDLLAYTDYLGKPNVRTYAGLLSPVYHFFLAQTEIRKLLERGAVINDIGIGGPEPSTAGLTSFLRSHNLDQRNKVIASDIVIPATIIRSHQYPDYFAYYDEQRQLIAAYHHGRALATNQAKEYFPVQLDDLSGQDYEPLPAYAEYAARYGFALDNSSYGRGVPADIKLCFDTLHLDQGHEVENIEKMGEDLNDNGFLLVGEASAGETGFILYQRQNTRLVPVSMHYVEDQLEVDIDLRRLDLSVAAAQRLLENINEIVMSHYDVTKPGLGYGLRPGDVKLTMLNVEPIELIPVGTNPNLFGYRLARLVAQFFSIGREVGPRTERILKIVGISLLAIEIPLLMWLAAPGIVAPVLNAWLPAGLALATYAPAFISFLSFPGFLAAFIALHVAMQAWEMRLAGEKIPWRQIGYAFINQLAAITPYVLVFVLASHQAPLVLTLLAMVLTVREHVTYDLDAVGWLAPMRAAFYQRFPHFVDFLSRWLPSLPRIERLQNPVLVSEKIGGGLAFMGLQSPVVWMNKGEDKRQGKISTQSARVPEKLDTRPGRAILINLAQREKVEAVLASPEEQQKLPSQARLYVGKANRFGQIELQYQGQKIYVPLTRRNAFCDVYVTDVFPANSHVLNIVLELVDFNQSIPWTLQVDTALAQDYNLLEYHDNLAMIYVLRLIQHGQNVDLKRAMSKLAAMDGLRFSPLTNGRLNVRVNGKDFPWYLAGEDGENWVNPEIIVSAYENDPGQKKGSPHLLIWMENGIRTKNREFKIAGWRVREGVQDILTVGEKEYVHGISIGPRIARQLFVPNRSLELEINMLLKNEKRFKSNLNRLQQLEYLRKKGVDPAVAAIALQLRQPDGPGRPGEIQEKLLNDEQVEIRREHHPFTATTMVELTYARVPEFDEEVLIGIDEPAGCKLLSELLQPEKAELFLFEHLGSQGWIDINDTEGYAGRTDGRGSVVLDEGVAFSPGVGVMAGWDVYVTGLRPANSRVIDVRLQNKIGKVPQTEIQQIDVRRVNSGNQRLRLEPRLGWLYLAEMAVQPQNVDWQEYFDKAGDPTGLTLGVLDTPHLDKKVGDQFVAWTPIKAAEVGSRGLIVAYVCHDRKPYLWVRYERDGTSDYKLYMISRWNRETSMREIVRVDACDFYGQGLSLEETACIAAMKRIQERLDTKKTALAAIRNELAQNGFTGEMIEKCLQLSSPQLIRNPRTKTPELIKPASGLEPARSVENPNSIFYRLARLLAQAFNVGKVLSPGAEKILKTIGIALLVIEIAYLFWLAAPAAISPWLPNWFLSSTVSVALQQSARWLSYPGFLTAIAAVHIGMLLLEKYLARSRIDWREIAYTFFQQLLGFLPYLSISILVFLHAPVALIFAAMAVVGLYHITYDLKALGLYEPLLLAVQRAFPDFSSRAEQWLASLPRIERLQNPVLVSRATDGGLVFMGLQPLVMWFRKNSGENRAATPIPNKTLLQELVVPEKASEFIGKNKHRIGENLLRKKEIYYGKAVGSGVVALRPNAEAYIPFSGERGADVYLTELRVVNDHVIEAVFRLERDGSEQFRTLQMDTDEDRARDLRKNGYLKFSERLACYYTDEMMLWKSNWPTYIRKLPDLRGLRFGQIKNHELRTKLKGKNRVIHLSGEKNQVWDNAIIDNYGCDENETPFIEVRLVTKKRTKIRVLRLSEWDGEVYNFKADEEDVNYLYGVKLDKRAARHIVGGVQSLEQAIERCRSVKHKNRFIPLVIALAEQADRYDRMTDEEKKSRISGAGNVATAFCRQTVVLTPTRMAELIYAANAAGEPQQLLRIEDPAGAQVLLETLTPKNAREIIERQLSWQAAGDKHDAYVGRTANGGRLPLEGDEKISPGVGVDDNRDIYFLERTPVNDHVLEIVLGSDLGEEEEHAFQVDTQITNGSGRHLAMFERLGIHYLKSMLHQPRDVDWKKYMQTLPSLDGVSFGIINENYLLMEEQGKSYRWRLLNEAETGWDPRIMSCHYNKREGVPHILVHYYRHGRVKYREFKIGAYLPQWGIFDLELIAERQYFFGVYISEPAARRLFPADNRLRQGIEDYHTALELGLEETQKAQHADRLARVLAEQEKVWDDLTTDELAGLESGIPDLQRPHATEIFLLNSKKIVLHKVRGRLRAITLERAAEEASLRDSEAFRHTIVAGKKERQKTLPKVGFSNPNSIFYRLARLIVQAFNIGTDLSPRTEKILKTIGMVLLVIEVAYLFWLAVPAVLSPWLPNWFLNSTVSVALQQSSHWLSYPGFLTAFAAVHMGILLLEKYLARSRIDWREMVYTLYQQLVGFLPYLSISLLAFLHAPVVLIFAAMLVAGLYHVTYDLKALGMYEPMLAAFQAEFPEASNKIQQLLTRIPQFEWEKRDLRIYQEEAATGELVPIGIQWPWILKMVDKGSRSLGTIPGMGRGVTTVKMPEVETGPLHAYTWIPPRSEFGGEEAEFDGLISAKPASIAGNAAGTKLAEIYESVITQGFVPQLLAYVKRFQAGLIASSPKKKLNFKPPQEIAGFSTLSARKKLLEYGLLEDENGVYWAIKKRNGSQNNPQHEKLAVLLTNGRANFTDIRLITPREWAGAKISLPGVSSDYYATRLVFPENIRNAKDPVALTADPAEASAGIFVNRIFIRMDDPHPLNAGYCGETPVGVDHAAAFKFSAYPPTTDGFLNFQVSFLTNTLIMPAYWYASRQTADEKVYQELKKTVLLLESRATPARKMSEIQRVLRQYNLGAGYIQAEQLDVAKVREAILSCKALGLEAIQRDVAGAGYTGLQFTVMLETILQHQKTLGHDVNEIWKLLTGKDPGFDKLDRIPTQDKPASAVPIRPDRRQNISAAEESEPETAEVLKTSEAEPQTVRQNLANQPLLALRPRLLKLALALFNPDLSLKASWRIFRPFGGLILMLIQLVGSLVLSFAPGPSRKAVAISELRLRQLVSQDELEARGIDLHYYDFRPLSESSRSWWQRLRHGSWLGDVSITASGRCIVYIPDVLYWGGENQSDWQQFFYDLTVWHNAALGQRLRLGLHLPSHQPRRWFRQRSSLESA